MERNIIAAAAIFDNTLRHGGKICIGKSGSAEARGQAESAAERFKIADSLFDGLRFVLAVNVHDLAGKLHEPRRLAAAGKGEKRL